LMEGMADPKISSIEEGQYLFRALNLLVVCLLENSDKTASFTVLLQLLRLTAPWDIHRPSNPKFTELVMKSLLKLTKGLHDDIENINLDLVLGDIHSFLEAHPPSKWKTASNDMPLRAIKTLLGEIVSLKGPSVTDRLTLIPLSSPPPAIVSYINLMLQSHNPNQPRPSQEIKSILTEIFKKIGIKETTQEGLYDLYQFKKSHSEVDIQPHLQRTSEHFQEYIKRGLIGIEQQHSENRDPNPTSNSDHFAMSYMDRLRKLQSQYGLKPSDDISGSEAASSAVNIDTLRMNINRIKANNETSLFSSTDAYADELNSLGGNIHQPRKEEHSTETTVEELRQRLARFKNAM